LTRKDLSRSSSAVQAGHALAEFLLRGPVTEWNNGTLVYLAVRNLEELVEWCCKLNEKRIKWVGFREPDLDDELTAIAVVSNDKMFFSRLRLL
jgi:hypothetical protein